ncbi:hypothetical protein BJ742DRAFT_102231 [Cladochytrium replicatum]|nr:hypothetical protein BJ742DRAFT_102231 [Cladochytrium replicatum]
MQQHQHQQQHDSPLSHSQPSDASTSTPSALPYPYPPPPPNPAMAHFLQPQHQQPFYPPPSVPGTDPAALASIVQYLAQMVVSAASAVSTPHAQLHPHALPPPSMLPPTSVPSFAGLPPPPYSAGGHLGYQHPGKLPGADYGAPSSSHYSSLPPPSAYGHSAVPPDFGTLVQQHAASAGLSPEMLAAVTAATLPGVSTLLSSSEPLLSQSLPAATMALLANTTQPYRVDPLTGRPMDDMSMLTLDPSAYARSIIPPNTHLGHMDAAEFAALTSPSSSAGSPHSRGSPTYAPSLAQSTQSQSPPPSSGLSSAPGEYDGDGSEPRVRTPENTVVSMALAAALSANAAAITARNEYDSAGSISTTPTTAPPSSDIGLSKGKDAIDGGRAKVPKARRSGKVTKEEPGVSDQSSAIDTSKRIPPSPPMEGGANATEWSADRVSMLHNVHLPTPSSPLTIQPINPSQYPPISDVVAAAAAAATAAYQGVVSPHPLPPPPEVESAPSMTKAGPGSNLFQFTLSRPTSSGAGDEKRSKKGKGAASSPSGDTGTPEKDGDDQSGQEDGEGTTETRAPGKHQRKVAHNAIERRYRNNINNRIADLKRVVPALLHAKISKDKRRGGNADSDSDSDGSSDDSDGERRKRPGGRKGKAPVQLIDGIPVATKLNKATILRKATEYIVHLKGVTSRLGAENEALKALAGALPGGQEALAAYASAQAHILARESANAAVAEAASKEAGVPLRQLWIQRSGRCRARRRRRRRVL